jgi:hypothetical protein
MTSQPDSPVKKKLKIPWYLYFIGASAYTALGGWLATESSPLSVVCLLSAPVGYFYAWKAWKQDRQPGNDT